MAYGQSLVRNRHAIDGVSAIAGQGCGFRLQPDSDTGRQGRERSHYHASEEVDRLFADAVAESAPASCSGLARGFWRGSFALCARAQVSARRLRMGLAVRISLEEPVGPSTAE